MSRIFLFLFTLFVATASPAQEAAEKLYSEADQLWLDKKLDEAAAKYQEAIKLEPTAKGYTKLGSLLMAQNKSGEAVEAYQQAIMLDAENPKLFMALAIAYLHRKEFTKASVMTQEALRLDPNLKNAKDMQKYLEEKKKQEEAQEHAMQQAHPAPTGAEPHGSMPAAAADAEKPQP